MISGKRFLLEQDSFKPNQKADLIFDENACTITVQQTTSTPGLRLSEPILLEGGDYELIVSAEASTENTFFLWVYDMEKKSSIGGTVHVSKKKEQLVTYFSLRNSEEIDIGVLSHSQEIGDSCKVFSIEIRPQVFENIVPKPLYLEANQRAKLKDMGDHWTVTANQRKSTPGCRLSLPVAPDTLHAINVEVEMNSQTASAFLWAYSRITGEEILPRVHLFSGGHEAMRVKKTVYLQVPEHDEEVFIGVLFSSAGLKPTDSFNLYSLEIEEITTLSDVVDRGYVLNLDGEEEKFRYCHHVLQREGFDVGRMPAVRGASEPYLSDYNSYANLPLNDEDARLGRKAIQSPGAWGYLLTMKNIFEDALSKGYESIAVFDDDIILTHDFTLKFSRFIKSVSDDWNILLLGASQWDWTGVEFSTIYTYKPNKLSNGSFAMIYHCSIFKEILENIEQMDSPFDSKPLKSIYSNQNRKCHVAWPNLIIADVEKEGIRDSRNQLTYASRFRWRMDEFPTNYKRWRSQPILLHENTPVEWPKPNSHHFVLAVTTINRWEYLEKFLTSWLRTRNNTHNWTLIVADDGSSDETLENLIHYDIGSAKLVILQNSGDGIARQTNSILNYCKKGSFEFDLLFSSDDDIFFIKQGWDDLYFKAIHETGYDHLVHFNEDWKPPLHIVKSTINGIRLESKTDVESCMGCFYTITPEVLEKVGGFDEDEFPIRGHSHIDFTMRACRGGFNNLETLFDVENATEYIGIHPKEGYVTTLRRYSYREQMTLSNPSEKARRWAKIRENNRIFVSLSLEDFFEPKWYHLDFTNIKFLPRRSSTREPMLAKTKKSPQIIHEIPPESEYDHRENWSYSEGLLKLAYKGNIFWWKMPERYSFDDAHPDLFKLAEYVLLSPLEPDILNGWVPSRKPGFRPGLAFSAGLDSTAAMTLLPEQTVLLYHKRTGFDTKLNHHNALRFIEYLRQEENRQVVVVDSNHELVRTLHESKSPGFMTDYACAVHAILLADLFSLDSIATGMPLENSFLWHGQKFRDFKNSWFWIKHAPLFKSVGLEILQPVMGCSEIINQKIVQRAGYLDLAQSCLRSSTSEPCGACWKCFRKNSLIGKEISMSSEIDTFLSQPRLKMAASTLYSVQNLKNNENNFYLKISNYPHVAKYINMDLSFLERHYPPSLDLLPIKYRSYVRKRLSLFVEIQDDLTPLESFNLYDD